MGPYCGLIAGFYFWQFGHSALALAGSALMSESPFKSFIPAAMAALSVGPLSKDSGDWGKRITDIHRIGLLIHLIMDMLLYISCSLVSILTRYKNLRTLYL